MDSQPVTVTINLSNNEIDILNKISSDKKISPNDALKEIIIQAGYLHQQTHDGNDILFGKIGDNKIKADSKVRKVNFDTSY